MRSFHLKLAAIAALLPSLSMLVIFGPAEFVRDLPGALVSGLLQSVLAAIPFLLAALALNSLITTKLPGYIGLALVLLVFGYATYDGYQAVHNYAGGGANIGLGIMIMAIPVIVTFVMCVVALATQLIQNVKAKS